MGFPTLGNPSKKNVMNNVFIEFRLVGTPFPNEPPRNIDKPSGCIYKKFNPEFSKNY